MDSAEEARDYDTMYHSAVNRVFVADFLAAWDGDGPILDVGTGTAQIPVELCRQAAAAEVKAIDLAEHMLALGRVNVRQAGFDHRLHLERCDAKKLPYAANSFGAVISNSIIHHIPEPKSVVAEMVRVLRPGGLLFVRDLLRPDSEGTLRHMVQTYAGDATAHQQQMFGASLGAALTLAEVQDLLAGLPLDGLPRQTTDRHWTLMARKK